MRADLITGVPRTRGCDLTTRGGNFLGGKTDWFNVTEHISGWVKPAEEFNARVASGAKGASVWRFGAASRSIPSLARES
jgi:hypothetical protein